ncbi:MAG: VTT domain-containing protein [Myxococcota bacterium]
MRRRGAAVVGASGVIAFAALAPAAFAWLGGAAAESADAPALEGLLARAGTPDDAPTWAAFAALVFAASMVSEDLACIGVGVLVGRGSVGLVGGSLACAGALVAGDLLLYAAGRGLGRSRIGRAIRRRARRAAGDARALRPTRLDVAIVASRFVPGARLPTYVTAGALRVPVARFTALLALAVAVWAPAVVGFSAAGWLAAGSLPVLRERAAAALVAVVLAALAIERVALPALTRGGRRRLASRWQRVRRWEFWPIPVVYAPLAPYIAWLALRHGGLRQVLLANPGIPLGGLAGESKRAILDALDLPDDARLATLALPALDARAPLAPQRAARRARVQAFLEREGLALPVVVKPDAGERGADVAIARDAAALARELDARLDATLVQERATGDEYGLYYARLPGEPRGRLLSITAKRMPVATGDGERTLEELILAHERGLPMARVLLAAHAGALDRVPAAGERVPLVEIGTHSRGCEFLDASSLWTPELETRVDALSRRFPGFFLGRYDVRVPDAEALRRGEGLRVVELNGLTTEPTHMYDPRHSYAFALRELAAHWRRAFAIGRAQRVAGAPLPAWREIARALARYRRLGARAEDG